MCLLLLMLGFFFLVIFSFPPCQGDVSGRTNKDGEAADTGLVVPTDVRESLCKSLFCSVVFILISGCLLINFISDSWDKSSL